MKKIVKRNQVIITSLAILIAVAGYLNFADVDLGFKDKEASTDSASILDQVDYDITDESALLEENSQSSPSDTEEDTTTPGEAVLTGASGFAAQAKLSREQVRSQSKADLQEIINNVDISDDQKQTAINTMVEMTEVSEKEAAAEMLLEAKGFENAVVNLDCLLGKSQLVVRVSHLGHRINVPGVELKREVKIGYSFYILAFLGFVNASVIIIVGVRAEIYLFSHISPICTPQTRRAARLPSARRFSENP